MHRRAGHSAGCKGWAGFWPNPAPACPTRQGAKFGQDSGRAQHPPVHTQAPPTTAASPRHRAGAFALRSAFTMLWGSRLLPALAEQWWDEVAGRCTAPHRQQQSAAAAASNLHARARSAPTGQALHPQAPWGQPQPPHAAAEPAAAARPAAAGPPPSWPPAAAGMVAAARPAASGPPPSRPRWRRPAGAALWGPAGRRLTQRLRKPRLAWRRLSQAGGPGAARRLPPGALAYRSSPGCSKGALNWLGCWPQAA